MNFWIQSKKTLQVFLKMARYLRLSYCEGADYQKLKTRYMRELVQHLGLQIHTKNGQVLKPHIPAIFVSNHISYLDIPVIMREVPHASFVSKSEVAAWPVIGKAAQRIGTVFVKRGCKKSRQETRDAIVHALVQERKSVAVFPSGTTKVVKALSWRRGVFEIAHEHKIPVIPIRLMYTPLRKAAYIDNDNFVLHLLALMKGEPIKVTVEFGEPQIIQNSVAEACAIHEWCEEGLPSGHDNLGVTLKSLPASRLAKALE